MLDGDDVTHWIERVKEGDSIAAHQIWQHYFERLVRAVRQRLRGQNRAVSDEEDVVASVFESFYQAAEIGRFPDLSDRDELWRLLLKMSARKIVDKQRHDRRQRRGAGIPIHSLNEGREHRSVVEVVGDAPTPEMVAIMAETFEQFFSHLGVGELQEIAVAKLEGHSNAEIARQLQCSERTIERRLHLIREKCQREWLGDNEHSSRKATDQRSGKD
jgi:RNA polymerase sigma factor (sigma-70 family)